MKLKQFSHYAANGQHIVETDYKGVGSLHVKWIFTPGSSVKLEYKYSQQGDLIFWASHLIIRKRRSSV